MWHPSEMPKKINYTLTVIPQYIVSILTEKTSVHRFAL